MNSTNEADDNGGYSVSCVTGTDEQCASTCVGLLECGSCKCAVQLEDAGGPWGDVMDVIFALLPVVFLIYVTMKAKPWPTTVSLPVAALLLAFLRLAYFQSDPLLVGGAIIAGIHEALTPLSIMAGAVTLFETMEATLCLPYMMREMKALSAGHPIAECMFIFAFAYLVEGASGFGTPAALSAPMLVSMGHPAMESVVLVLLFNTFATVWGAVGTPIWFGFGQIIDPVTELPLSEDNLLEISQKAAIALGVACVVLIPFILTIVVPRALVTHNWMFVLLSLVGTVGTSATLAQVNYEFPSLVGGLVGCAINSLLISYKIGLNDVADDLVKNIDQIAGLSDHGLVRSYHRSSSNISSTPLPPPSELNNSKTTSIVETPPNPNVETTDDPDVPSNMETVSKDALPPMDPPTQMSLEDTVEAHLGPRKSMREGYVLELLLRTFPIWGVVFVLILTRVQAIGLKSILQQRTPYFSIHFGTYGTFRLSASLVFQLRDIFTYPNLNWRYELLYVPFLIPFVLVSVITMILFRKDLTCHPFKIARTVVDRLYAPAIALMGALVLVQLMIVTGTVAPAFILGTILADWFQEAFVIICPLLGALGSFFSGSTTVSNLTFGSIQEIAAESIGTSVTSMLALQAVGASAGNGICLNNIIAACAVVGLNVGEGVILFKTYKFVFLCTTLATVVMLAFYFRF
jgi:L-lactate permease